MKPRPYQTEAVLKIRHGFKEFKKQLAVLPTGSGKTILFSWLAEEIQPLKTLILCHRQELLTQAVEKLRMATGIRAELEKAEWTASAEAPVVVASVQSMIRRLDRWPSDHFHLVVADEAHHAVSESWQKVLNHFDSYVLGCTATPDRADQRTLGEYFENVAVDISLVRLIREQYLSNIVIKSVPLKIDLTKVHLQGGDFDEVELGHLLEPYLVTIAQAIRDHASFRKVLAFLPLIDTSRKFVEACRQVGLTAKHVDGKSPDRAEILQQFDNNQFDVLSNAMLLVEGYDSPSIDCIVVLRPTKSRPLFAQMVGRGTRVHPAKENLLLLDFLWLHERHRIVHPADLMAHDAEEADIVTELSQKLSAQGASEEQLDLLTLAASATEERERKLRERLAELASRKAKFISPEQFCLEHGETETAFYEPTMKWEGKPITRKQMKYLERTKIDPDLIKGRGHASKLLDVMFKHKDLELASQKQRWSMQQHGHPDPWMATKAEARRFFAQLNRKK
jgi:superfamily II DNA or RNA helicase